MGSQTNTPVDERHVLFWGFLAAIRLGIAPLQVVYFLPCALLAQTTPLA